MSSFNILYSDYLGNLFDYLGQPVNARVTYYSDVTYYKEVIFCEIYRCIKWISEYILEFV